MAAYLDRYGAQSFILQALSHNPPHVATFLAQLFSQMLEQPLLQSLQRPLQFRTQNRNSCLLSKSCPELLLQPISELLLQLIRMGRGGVIT